MRKYLILFISITSLLLSEELPSLNSTPELDGTTKLSEKERSQFFYFSGGTDGYIFPTLSLGYRKIYSAFGSDISLSGTVIPSFNLGGGFGKTDPHFVALLHYNQLFFIGEKWNNIKTGKSAFYLGLKTGLFPTDVGSEINYNYFLFGGLAGMQTKRERGASFFEVGFTPCFLCFKKRYFYSEKREIVSQIESKFVAGPPVISLSYGILL